MPNIYNSYAEAMEKSPNKPGYSAHIMPMGNGRYSVAYGVSEPAYERPLSVMANTRRNKNQPPKNNYYGVTANRRRNNNQPPKNNYYGVTANTRKNNNTKKNNTKKNNTKKNNTKYNMRNRTF